MTSKVGVCATLESSSSTRPSRTAGRRAMNAGQSFVWEGPAVGPLVAVSLAHLGLAVYGALDDEGQPVSPVGIDATEVAASRGPLDDLPNLNDVQF